MFEKLSAFYNVFRAGQAVADAYKLHQKQALGNALATLLGGALMILRMKGIDLHVSDQDLVAICMGIASAVSVFNGAAAVAASDRIGILPARQSDPASQPGVPELAPAESPEPVLDQHPAAAGPEPTNIWANPPANWGS